MSTQNASWAFALFVATTATIGLASYGCSDGGGGSGGGPGDTCDAGAQNESDTLEVYAAKCFDAIGLEVPAFNCDDGGVVIPTDNEIIVDGGPDAGERFCDRPNVLNQECDRDSKFHVLAQNEKAIVVAICRKKGHIEGRYGDIAVIQYNQENGATCFYQALELAGGAGKDLPAEVTAPREGTNAGFPWFSPFLTALSRCVLCHDNGPFIRSPYLAQLRNEPMHRVPGTNDFDNDWGPRYAWNLTQPYTFVGNNFKSWKAYQVSITGNLCTSCHRMGLATIDGEYGAPIEGTSREFGRIATAMEQMHKNPHSPDAPIWMLPDQIYYDAGVEDAAIQIESCAEAVADAGTPTPGCQVVQFGQAADPCSPVPSVVQPPMLNP